MQFDQLLRRLAWRTRRRLRPGADHEPIVAVESASPQPRPRANVFSITLVVLGGLLIAASAFLALQGP
jgi:hypothetical protein